MAGKGFKGARAKSITVTFNEEEYTASPLTFDDFNFIWDEVQKRKLRLLSSIEDRDERKELRREILSQPMTMEFFNELSSAHGITTLVWASLRKENDGLEREDIENLAIGEIEDLADIVTQISGLTEEENKGKKGGQTSKT